MFVNPPSSTTTKNRISIDASDLTDSDERRYNEDCRKKESLGVRQDQMDSESIRNPDPE